jgi:sugar/nucleoside kinase (ribokinase family)
MNPSADIIVAGHICLDLIPALPSATLPSPGRLMKIGPATISTGGAVANTGLALHRLGTAVRLMGKVGDDVLGRAVLDVLKSHDPAILSGMIVVPGEATSYSVVISPPGLDRSFMHCPGANDTFTADDVPYDTLQPARIFHFGYPPIMRRMFLEDGFQLQRMFQKVRDAGLITSLDMCQPDPASEAGQIDWQKLLARTLPLVDVFLPSIDELLFMLDRPAHDRLTAGAAFTDVVDGKLLDGLGRRLLAMGATVVAIKLGEQGLYVRSSADVSRIKLFCARLNADRTAWTDKEIISPCFRAAQVVGTTGSGDCTIAGFLTALLRGAGPTEAATTATAVGAASVEAADASSGVVSWPQIDQRVRAGWPRLPFNLAFNDSTLIRDSTGTMIVQRSELR